MEFELTKFHCFLIMTPPKKMTLKNTHAKLQVFKFSAGLVVILENWNALLNGVCLFLGV